MQCQIDVAYTFQYKHIRKANGNVYVASIVFKRRNESISHGETKIFR